MELMVVLLAVTAFPAGCLLFVLWMGAIEDSIPAAVRRAVRRPDPPPIVAVPVRRTAATPAPGWWESVATDPAPGAVPAQRAPAAAPIPAPAPVPVQVPVQVPVGRTAVVPRSEPLAGT